MKCPRCKVDHIETQLLNLDEGKRIIQEAIDAAIWEGKFLNMKGKRGGERKCEECNHIKLYRFPINTKTDIIWCYYWKRWTHRGWRCSSWLQYDVEGEDMS